MLWFQLYSLGKRKIRTYHISLDVFSPKIIITLRCLGGSVGWASDFSSGHDHMVCEFKPCMGLCADSSEPRACFRFSVSCFLPVPCLHFLCLCLSLSLSLSKIIIIVIKHLTKPGILILQQTKMSQNRGHFWRVPKSPHSSSCYSESNPQTSSIRVTGELVWNAGCRVPC